MRESGWPQRSGGFLLQICAAWRNPFRRLREGLSRRFYYLELDKNEGICYQAHTALQEGLKVGEHFPYLKIAREYEHAGADAISVLTEPKWFLGSDEYLREIADAVAVPCLRKDFTVDPYMIYEAKLLGASAVLLIVSLLDAGALREYLKICDSLGLSALTEIHDETEAEIALSAGARIVGVNNRNLRDFTVDTGNSARLRARIPSDVVFVAESGVRTAEDTAVLRQIGADAALVGESLMRAENIAAKLAELRGE